MKERWTHVVGYEGLYEISSRGRIRSRRRLGTAGGIIRPYLAGLPRRKYLRVVLHKDGKRHDCNVSRLVLASFKEPCPREKTDACHKNDDQFDNRLENLYWGTRTENLADAKRNKRLRPRIGPQVGIAKLSESDVRKIMEMRAAGHRQVDVAAEFGVSQATISGIECGIVWPQVTGLRRQQPYGRRKPKS